MNALTLEPPVTERRAPPIALADVISTADALLIVPPFARLDLPHLGLHLLQACARRAGFEVAVLYAGMYLAREIGDAAYYAIAESATPHLLGERIFARAAYGVDLLGRRAEAALADLRLELGYGPRRCTVDRDLLRRLALHAEGWADRMAAALAEIGCPIVGCSTMFEQTAASIALLSRLKRLRPSTVTLLGGANCFDAMAGGIAALSGSIDYVFSGESEAAFPAFLAGARPSGRIVEGAPCMDLDGLPTPDYADFYRQRRACLGDGPAERDGLLLSVESSRGCWWGQKHHCTFCGVAVMRYREKSPDRVIEELRELLSAHPSRRIHFTDDIMPHTYFRTLIPRLGDELPGLTIFYEQKANITLERLIALRRAGVSIIQPGIEALSSSLLARMDKGLLARQNVALLRYARALRVNLVWGLLHGFPGDGRDDYDHYLALLPLLRHLEPPRDLLPLALFRFSPYGRWPERHGIANFRPAAAYADVLPDGADAGRLAYQFEGDFDSIISQDPELCAAIRAEIRGWNADWIERAPRLPELSIQGFGPDMYLLTDTRGLPGAPEVQLLPVRQAAAVLVGRPLDGRGELAEEQRWAVANRYAVELDGWHVPLATAPGDVLARFEREHGAAAGARGAAMDPGQRTGLVTPAALSRRARATAGR
ncbi:RiPP maturation radical SAM C-methyltransferase [Sorangium atrum]|uniref:RiPP maturation radical SAM C-methyltransferase n=1 Tax=Sorangium atrum TaxID=2995308 RepID=A0ABT5C4P9_9BACT|nr:RiPP maturation radical SAM C-methyltransferase [Sorangium aterium]MDC0681388.1 RiPP maturation radical SAM C-methyltransferase [Sorangium aterium]